MGADTDCIEALLKKASWRHRELCGSTVDIVHGPLSPLDFYRDYVAANKPCIIRGAIEDWPALTRWDKDYLIQKVANKKVPVAITPNGRADAVTRDDKRQEVFALPYEDQMEMSELLEHLESPHEATSSAQSQRDLTADSCSRDCKNAIYMQQQNDCLRQNFPELLPDVLGHKDSLDWADRIFGQRPEAINLWIGNRDSVTSFHKDHYENLFAVIRGKKIFTLLPPNDIYRLYLRKVNVARYTLDYASSDVRSSEMRLQIEEPVSEVLWSSLDPDSPEKDRHLLFYSKDLPQPIVVEVNPGDILYLPSLWHHQVKQDSENGDVCIAVNFWYDMVMGAHYSNFCLAEDLSQLLVTKADKSH